MNSDAVSRYDPNSEPFRPTWPVEVDLHLHTTASDGLLTPTALIEMVAATSLKIVSVTDHDSTEGIDEALEAAKAYPHLQVIPGIEFGAEIDESEVHLLGLFIDHKNRTLQDHLEKFRRDRVDTARKMVEKLATLGVHISWDRVQELAEGSVGRPHIARTMVEAGYVETVPEAFDRYLGSDGPARVPRPKLAPVDALKLVHAAGGVGIVAHPRTVNHLDEILPSLVDEGLAGIEVFAEKYGIEHQQKYRDLASQYNLIESGGTDYHGFGNRNEVTPGTSGPPPDTAQRLYKRAQALHGDKVGFVPARPL